MFERNFSQKIFEKKENLAITHSYGEKLKLKIIVCY